MNKRKNILPKSKLIQKPKKQKNILDSYFLKTKEGANGIFLERLQQEIEQQCADSSEIVVETTNNSNEGDSERANFDNVAQDDMIALKERYIVLENKCKELTLHNQKLTKDNRVLKKMLDASKSLNLCKDLTIKNLSHQSTTQTVTSNNVITNDTPKILFGNYEHHFSEMGMNSLRSIGKGKSKDAIFIATCLEYLYGGDVSKLAVKSSGDRKTKGKSQITPNKKIVMQNLLDERVESENCDEHTFSERRGRLNRLIGDGLYTITKRRMPKNHTEITAKSTVHNLYKQNLQQQNQQYTTVNNTYNGQQSQQPQLIPQQFDAYNFVNIPLSYFGNNSSMSPNLYIQ